MMMQRVLIAATFAAVLLPGVESGAEGGSTRSRGVRLDRALLELGPILASEKRTLVSDLRTLELGDPAWETSREYSSLVYSTIENWRGGETRDVESRELVDRSRESPRPGMGGGSLFAPIPAWRPSTWASFGGSRVGGESRFASTSEPVDYFQAARMVDPNDLTGWSLSPGLTVGIQIDLLGPGELPETEKLLLETRQDPVQLRYLSTSLGITINF